MLWLDCNWSCRRRGRRLFCLVHIISPQMNANCFWSVQCMSKEVPGGRVNMLMSQCVCEPEGRRNQLFCRHVCNFTPYMSHENEMSLLACLITPQRFANTVKPKAVEVIAPQLIWEPPCCWAVISSNMLSQHAIIWLSIPLYYPLSIFSHPALPVSAWDYSVVTDLQAHAPCKHKQLATIENPCMVLWQWMDMFNQYNPLNWDGHSRLLQG